MSEESSSNEVNVDLSTTEQTDGNIHSFDDLESMTESRSDSDIMNEAVKEVKESTNKIEKSNKEVKEEIAKASNRDKEAKAEDQDVQQNIRDEVEEELVQEIKKLHAKFKDEELEIPEEAVIKVKIDGEEVEVPIAELRNNYSGKVAYEKKFNELSNERKQFSTDKQTIEKYVMEFGELSRKGDKIGAMQYLAQLSGMDPLQFRKELRDQVLNEYSSLMNMDENQRKAFELEEENKFLKESKESETQRLQREQENLQAQQKISQYQEALGVDNEFWSNAQQELLEQGYSEEQVTPETIGKYIHAVNTYENAESVLNEVSDELSADSTKLEAMFDIINQNPDFSREDLVEIAIETWGEAKKSKTGSRKAQASAKKPEEMQETKPKSSKVDEFYSFEQLDNI